MNKSENIFKPLRGPMALLLVAFVAGCGGGKDPILGGGGTGAPGILGAPAGAIIPGDICTAATGPTVPTVTLSDPTHGNQFVTTSTTGVANGGKLITAAFSLAMNPITIDATTFTLTPVGGVALTPAVPVSYNASTKVATFTTAAALLPDTSYTATITQGAVTLATSTPTACIFAWNFKTAVTAAAGLPPVNLGLAAPFAIAAAAGVTNCHCRM